MRPGHCSIFVLRKRKKTPFSFTVQQDGLISFEENFILLFRGHPVNQYFSVFTLHLGSGHVINWYVNTSAQSLVPYHNLSVFRIFMVTLIVFKSDQQPFSFLKNPSLDTFYRCCIWHGRAFLLLQHMEDKSCDSKVSHRLCSHRRKVLQSLSCHMGEAANLPTSVLEQEKNLFCA